MLFSRSLPRQHFSADRSKISFAFSNDAEFTPICCSNECAMSNDSQSSPLLFHHFCSREILSGSGNFHAVGLVQEGVAWEHSPVDRLWATKERPGLMGIGVSWQATTVHASGGDV